MKEVMNSSRIACCICLPVEKVHGGARPIGVGPGEGENNHHCPVSSNLRRLRVGAALRWSEGLLLCERQSNAKPGVDVDWGTARGPGRI